MNIVIVGHIFAHNCGQKLFFLTARNIEFNTYELLLLLLSSSSLLSLNCALYAKTKNIGINSDDNFVAVASKEKSHKYAYTTRIVFLIKYFM